MHRPLLICIHLWSSPAVLLLKDMGKDHSRGCTCESLKVFFLPLKRITTDLFFFSFWTPQTCCNILYETVVAVCKTASSVTRPLFCCLPLWWKYLVKMRSEQTTRQKTTEKKHISVGLCDRGTSSYSNMNKNSVVHKVLASNYTLTVSVSRPVASWETCHSPPVAASASFISSK